MDEGWASIHAAEVPDIDEHDAVSCAGRTSILQKGRVSVLKVVWYAIIATLGHIACSVDLPLGTAGFLPTGCMQTSVGACRILASLDNAEGVRDNCVVTQFQTLPFQQHDNWELASQNSDIAWSTSSSVQRIHMAGAVDTPRCPGHLASNFGRLFVRHTVNIAHPTFHATPPTSKCFPLSLVSLGSGFLLSLAQDGMPQVHMIEHLVCGHGQL